MLLFVAEKAHAVLRHKTLRCVPPHVGKVCQHVEAIDDLGETRVSLGLGALRPGPVVVRVVYGTNVEGRPSWASRKAKGASNVWIASIVLLLTHTHGMRRLRRRRL